MSSLERKTFSPARVKSGCKNDSNGLIVGCGLLLNPYRGGDRYLLKGFDSSAGRSIKALRGYWMGANNACPRRLWLILGRK